MPDVGRHRPLDRLPGSPIGARLPPEARLASLTNNLTGTANDLSATFVCNPASQVASTVRTGDAYAYTDHFNLNVTGTTSARHSNDASRRRNLGRASPTASTS